MNNELNIMNEAMEQTAEAPETPEVFAEQLVETVEATAEEAVVDEDDAAAAEAVALALAAEEAAEEESAEVVEESACECCEAAEVVEEPACECCEAAEVVEEPACECCEAAEVTEEPVEDDEEPVVAPVFDEDEEFVPPITFSDDYDDPVDDRDEDYYAPNATRVRIHLNEEAEKKAAEPVVVKKATLGHKIGNFVYHNKIALLIGAGIAVLAAVGIAARFMA